MAEVSQRPLYRTDWFVRNTIAIDNVDNDIEEWATEVQDFKSYIKIVKIREEKRY